MGIVILDKKLKVKQSRNALSLESLKESLTDKKTNYVTREVTQSLFPVKDNISGKSFYHKNYLSYLELAWASHYGIVFNPDILWYTLLCELASIVKEDPEKYRFLFTDSKDKKDIIVLTDDPIELPLHLIISYLQDLVPSDTDVFMPSFTTTSDRAKTAQRAAFADLVSPYYNYSMLLCGFPYIDVRGEEQDWLSVGFCWGKIGELFASAKADKNILKYIEKVKGILASISLNSKNLMSDFWQDMFYLKNCGSGHEAEAFGWFTDLFLKSPKIRYVGNFTSQISNVDYVLLDTGDEFQMKQGLFYSDLQDDLLVPEFGSVILKKRK